MLPEQDAEGKRIGKWVSVAGGLGNALWSGQGFSGMSVLSG